MTGELASETVFRSRNDLITNYGDNARLLFALQLKFRIEDINSVASLSLTDGSDDKKCDLVYVDNDSGVAVIAQSYESQDITKPEAQANKASDLNIAISWLFTQTSSALPERLRPAAEELRNGIINKNIRTLYLWYVHNLPESGNVKRELRTVEHTAQDLLTRNYPDNAIEIIQAIEVGKNTLEEWYETSNIPILITDKISVNIAGGYSIAVNDWSAYVTSVPAKWLYYVYKKYGTKLFSANIRDYLGSRRSDKNINFNIKITAKNDPQHFWTYNNGITALVNDFNIQNDSILELNGLSIVNGAQTTGAIGSLDTEPDANAYVSIRFVKCTDQLTVLNIIQFNNSQNKIKASDFRSNDPVQSRLKDEFKTIPNANYLGGRRGGIEDYISRPQNLVPTKAVAMSLVSFHLDPILAYNKESEIWGDDETYVKYFNNDLHAKHIIFVYSLLRAIEEKKNDLRQKVKESESLTETEEEIFRFLRYRGAPYLFVAAISKCCETFLGQSLPNRFRISFNGNLPPSEAILKWKPIIETVIPFTPYLIEGVEGVLNNHDRVQNSIRLFLRYIESTKLTNISIFTEFARDVNIS